MVWYPHLLYHSCLVFRTIPRLFEATKTRGGLNTINYMEDFVDENALQELVGPRPNGVNKIQNGRHVNKGRLHRSNYE